MLDGLPAVLKEGPALGQVIIEMVRESSGGKVDLPQGEV